jgi:hypothetical protein
MYTCSAWNNTLDGLKLLHSDKIVLWFPGWSLGYLWVDDRYWWEEVLSMSRSQDMSSTERSWDFVLLSGTIGEGGSFRIEVELVREPEASEALPREPRVPEGMQRGPGGPQGSLEGFECPLMVFEAWNGNGVECTSTLGVEWLVFSGRDVGLTSVRDK